MTAHHEAPHGFTSPNDILAQCTELMPTHKAYIEHELIQRFGSPEQKIHVDDSIITINGVSYDSPLILPIYNGHLELVQCAVMQEKKTVAVTPDRLAKGFARYGHFDHTKPVIITYSLEAFFKVAQTDYAVVLVVLPTLCSKHKSELKPFDFKQIEFVINQLSQTGYQQLYLPVRREDSKAFKPLEESTTVRLLLQCVGSNYIEITQYEDVENIQAFLQDSIEQLPPLEEAEADPLDNDILRLANLTELQYEQTRTAEAEQLGIRASVLDKLVKAKRKEIAENKHRDDFFEHVEAWHTPVSGHDLLNSIEQIVNDHIACEPQTRTAVTLWILFTWAIDAMQIAPIACITAPEKRCGKTQLLTLIGELCYKPLPTSNISSSAMYRSIEAWKPTLLIDEADTFLKENEDLRGVINAGHSRKNAFVIRCDGEDNKPTRFNVYCAKAISGIGHLPETIKDRSIILELRRKLPSEQKLRLRHANQAEWHNIKRKCLRWVSDNFEVIKTTRPQLPEQLHDRAQDNWECLFIIAQLASDEWLNKANKAALLIDEAEIVPLSINEQLLTDIKQIFSHYSHSKIHSEVLVSELNADNEKMWASWNKGKPITQNQLAARLKLFCIKSKKVRVKDKVLSGYELSQFDDAFKRYVPETGIQNVTTLQPMLHKAYSKNQSVTQKNNVTFQKPLKPSPHKTCNDVTFQNGVTGGEQHCNEVTTPKKQVKAKASQPQEVIDTKTIDMFGGGV
ncbi:DUF3631 domain-containing protein [Acinetobacter sp. YH01003]|uniref:DUF3631 domain-containing protein n=1 Tax=Acinetobacter sp. YH01003 TaxID=2601019 RepID=UPI0015D3CC74|nr:DUF3631 domain-containing protein [Acinetobacter sp. YH01003]